MSFIKRIWESLTGAIQRLLYGIPNHLPDIIEDALAVTTVLRDKLRSNLAVAITDLIPGERDNVIREQVVSALDQAIPLLSISKDCGTDLGCWSNKLKELPADLQDAILIKLAAKIVATLDGGKMPQNRYDFYTQAHLTGKKL